MLPGVGKTRRAVRHHGILRSSPEVNTHDRGWFREAVHALPPRFVAAAYSSSSSSSSNYENHAISGLCTLDISQSVVYEEDEGPK